MTQRDRWTPIAASLSLPTQIEAHRSGTALRAAVTPKSRGGTDQDLLEVAHVAPHVAPAGREVENRVGDELAGAVERELAAAVGDAERDASLEEEVLRDEELAEPRVPARR